MGILKDVQRTGEPERRVDNVMRRTLKAGEEFGELAEAVLSATSASRAKGKTWMDIVEEGCDVAIMGLDVALTHPPDWGEIDDDMWRAFVKKIIETKLAKWKHQLRGKSTITAEGRPPKFTEEEHRRVLEVLAEEGIVIGPSEEEPEPAESREDKMQRVLNTLHDLGVSQSSQDDIRGQIVAGGAPDDDLSPRTVERHLPSDYDMTGTEFIYASDPEPPGTVKLTPAEQLDAEEDEELHK